jgi:TM2 domain-containing membrane protein YozV
MSSSGGGWYYSHDGERAGPVGADDLKAMAQAGRLRANDLVWKEGLAEWVPASSVEGLLPMAPSSVPGPPPFGQPSPDAAIKDFAGKKIAAGICGILIGWTGVHKFILGLTTPGIIMLLVSLTICGSIPMVIIGLVEGILYLTKSDQEFYQLYAIDKKGWF